MQILIGAVIAVVLATAPMAPTGRTRFPYWQMVDDVVKQIEAAAPRPLSINDGLRTPGQEYPFESFRHLRPTDLVRAAREGIQVARDQAAVGQPAAEVERQVLRNITVALEYLPLLIRDEKDIDELLSILKGRSEDPVLRRYVLERTVAGYREPDLLSLALPMYFAARDEQFREIMTQIASHPGERPEIQVIAIEMFFTYIRNEYQEVFENDPRVAGRLESGETVSHAMAVNEEIELARDTMTELQRLGIRLERFAEAIAGHVAEGSVRDERVKAATRKVLEETRDTIVGVNRDQLARYLEGRAPEPEMAFPAFPPMPETLPGGQGGMTPVPLPADGGPVTFESLGL